MKQINFRKNEKITVGLILLLLCIFLAVLVPALSPWTSTEMHADIRSQGMSFAHPFGTDKFGRDLFVRVWCGVFVRVWCGVRISLCVGLASALLNGALGILYGAASGYAGKTADNILMRIADIVASVPSLLYVILNMMVLGANEVGILYGAASGYAGKTADNILMRIADIVASVPSLLYVILNMMVLGANEASILVGLCISSWIETARIVRGEVMRIKEREFVLASRLAGAGPLRIFLTHLLPNAAGPIVVSLTFLVPQAIFTEAFLSFMGVGIPAPGASLGTMIQAARSQILPIFCRMLRDRLW